MAVDYNDLLYEKAQKEYDDLIAELKELPSEQVIERAYEKVIKENILCILEDSQRNMTEKLNLLLEYQKIPQEQNGEWLRQNGLHEEHLNLFQQEITKLMADKSDDKDREIKELKKQLAKKDKELKRKEAALAELAAIMTLKKKLGWMDDSSEEDV